MFSNKTIRFLKELDNNNNREWFNTNKQRYEDDVRSPALAFIESMAPSLQRVSPYFDASAKKVGGSLKRAPKGFSPDHPMIEDLKRKDFIAVSPILIADVSKADFQKRVGKLIKTSSPLMQFLCEADDLMF